MMQLIQVMRLTYLVKEVKPESTSVEKQPEKVTGKGVDAGDEKDTADSSSIADWEEKDVLLRTIRNPVNKENKVINFARGLGLKYKAFRTVMLGEAPYRTLNQVVNALRGFDMRGDEEEVLQQNSNIAFSVVFSQRGRVKRHYTQKRGATSHMTNNSVNGNDKIIIGNGPQLDITHVGNTIRSGLKLQDVLLVRKIAKNLLSVSKIAKDNSCTLEFDETDFVIKDKKTRTLLAKGYKRNRIYALKDNHLYALTARQDWKTSDNIWNNRLGNPSLKILNYLNSSSCINAIDSTTPVEPVLLDEPALTTLLVDSESNPSSMSVDESTEDISNVETTKAIFESTNPTLISATNSQGLQQPVDLPKWLNAENQPVNITVTSTVNTTEVVVTSSPDGKVQTSPEPQRNHMITKNKAKSVVLPHLYLFESKEGTIREPKSINEALKLPHWSAQCRIR
ncbi:hypothetical protein BC332_30435 [Capsicum chinense]|nr:hypothetical protein BC332_30435 [Capsicum chinense]